METNIQLLSEWKSSTKKIFWSTILLFFAGVISTIYDYISYAAAIFSMVSGMASSALGSLGRGSVIDMSDFVEWGLSSKGLVIIGYILYIWGLTSFASIQRLEETSTQVRKIRTAGIILAIVVMIDMVFGVLGSIPVLGWFFRLFVFIMTLYCYYKMKNAAGKLMVAEDFNDRAKRGSRNLRFAAVCEIRLMWLPLWTAIVMLILAVFGLWMFGLSKNIQAAEDVIKFMGGMYGFVVFIVCIIAACSMFCAFWWPIMGWYRVMTGGPADPDEHQQETQQEPIAEEPVADELVAEPLQEPKAENIVEIEEEKTSWFEENKKWLLPVGGVIVLALLIWGAFTVFGSNKGNDLLPVQKPAWEKFVVVLNDEVAVFKEAKTISPQLQIMQENLDSDAAAQYFKWSDDSDKRGYSSSNYLLSRNKILPVVGEEGEWYKVTVSAEYVGTVDCYIQKTYCREVKPEPITPEVLNGMKSYNWYTAFYGLQTDGKLKNICFVSVMGEMEGEWLDVAVLYDGVLINPLTKRISTQLNHNENADPLVVSSENGYTCLYYSDSMTDNYVLDARRISQEAKSSKIDLNHLFESIPTSQSSIQQVSYYFPEIDKEHLFTFIQDVSGSQSSANIDGVEDKKEFSGYTFFTDKLDGMVGLYAEVDGDRRCTDIEGERIDVLGQDDYDGDGEREVLVYVWGGGNAIEPPFIVYFDKETQEFKKALGFNDASDSPEVKEEQWNGKISFRVDVGLRKDRYVYENHEVKLVESIAPNLSEVISTITVKQVFGSREEFEEKTISLDVDGIEGKEQLLFMHDTSHLLGWGKQMQLKRISGYSWSFPKSEDEEFQMIGSKFTFIKSDNLIMPDILCDDAWLYKWIDESYVMQ